MSDDTREVCGHEKGDGGRCESAIGLCEEDGCGKCFAHCEHRAEKAREARQKGAASTNAKRRGEGLAPHELPPLESHDAAEEWLETVGRCVGTGRLSASEGNAIRGCVRDWVQAREAGEVSDRLNRLESALSEWRETGDASELLEVVEGGRAS